MGLLLLVVFPPSSYCSLLLLWWMTALAWWSCVGMDQRFTLGHQHHMAAVVTSGLLIAESDM
jgi:hypothetical protein